MLFYHHYFMLLLTCLIFEEEKIMTNPPFFGRAKRADELYLPPRQSSIHRISNFFIFINVYINDCDYKVAIVLLLVYLFWVKLQLRLEM